MKSSGSRLFQERLLKHFNNEARTLALLDHPNIIKINEYIEN